MVLLFIHIIVLFIHLNCFFQARQEAGSSKWGVFVLARVLVECPPWQRQTVRRWQASQEVPKQGREDCEELYGAIGASRHIRRGS